MKSLQRIFAIVLKEIRQLRRDRLTFGMIVGIPVMQLLLFGYAINTDVRHLSAAVADLSSTAASRQLVMDLANTQVIDIQYQVADTDALERLMRQGRISVGIFIPGDFERRLQQPERAAAQLLIDGSDNIVQGAAALLARSARTSPYNDQPPVMELRTYYNPERRSPVNTVPGLVGIILTMTMTLFTAVAIVRERERGNLELLITTPVRSSELMLAKILPYVFIGLIQVSLVLLLGHLLFAVPLRGALMNVYWVSLVFIVANLAHGPGHLDARADPVPGHADDLLHPAAVDPAVRFHVPVRRHAQASPVDRRSAADDPLHAPDPRGGAARRLSGGAVSGTLHPSRIHRGGDDRGGEALPEAVGLERVEPDCLTGQSGRGRKSEVAGELPVEAVGDLRAWSVQVNDEFQVQILPSVAG